MPKAVMQNMQVSFLPGKNLNKHGDVSCSILWMQMEVSWLLERRNQVDDASHMSQYSSLCAHLYEGGSGECVMQLEYINFISRYPTIFW